MSKLWFAWQAIIFCYENVQENHWIVHVAINPFAVLDRVLYPKDDLQYHLVFTCIQAWEQAFKTLTSLSKQIGYQESLLLGQTNFFYKQIVGIVVCSAHCLLWTSWWPNGATAMQYLRWCSIELILMQRRLPGFQKLMDWEQPLPSLNFKGVMELKFVFGYSWRWNALWKDFLPCISLHTQKKTSMFHLNLQIWMLIITHTSRTVTIFRNMQIGVFFQFCQTLSKSWSLLQLGRREENISGTQDFATIAKHPLRIEKPINGKRFFLGMEDSWHDSTAHPNFHRCPHYKELNKEVDNAIWFWIGVQIFNYNKKWEAEAAAEPKVSRPFEIDCSSDDNSTNTQNQASREAFIPPVLLEAPAAGSEVALLS
jgi:hypothetical protein